MSGDIELCILLIHVATRFTAVDPHAQPAEACEIMSVLWKNLKNLVCISDIARLNCNRDSDWVKLNIDRLYHSPK